MRPAIPNGAPGSGLTLVTGPNNSGKSTLLEVLKIRGQNAPSFHVGQRNELTDFVTLEFEFDTHLETVCSLKKGSSESVSTNCKINEAPVYYVPSRRHINHSFGKNHPADRASHMNSFMNSGQDRGPSINGFEARFLKLEVDQDLFNPFLRKILPDLLEWAVDQDQNSSYFIKKWSENKKHSSAGLGEGVISAFVIAASLYDSKPGETIVIDEPELSLHPSVQKRLIALIEELSSDRQIIIATHSPYFITQKSICGGCSIVRSWDRKGAIEVYTTSINDDKVDIDKLIAVNVNNPHVFGLNAREVFFLEDGVLVLEGQEDAVLWPVYVDDNAFSYNIFGWGAGGAGNVPHVLSLLKALGFMQVAAILDNDQGPTCAVLKEKYPDYFCAMIPAPDIRTKGARATTAEKLGLLNSKMQIRDTLKDELEQLVQSIHATLVIKADNTN